jgi:uncharacterized protein YbjT (DUF2867 family)
MKILLFGASGMVGQGVLRECLLDADVSAVVAVGRAASGVEHAKLRDVVHRDFLDFSAIATEFTGVDACFYCLGVSSAGISEADYRRITLDFTVSAAKMLLAQSPRAVFVFVSGAGTDPAPRGSTMWARVKGQAENALLAMPFRGAYMFRPAYIQPLHGVVSRTRLYRALYAVTSPLYPLLKRALPKYVTTTERVGRAMLVVAKQGATKRVLESADLDALAGPPTP